MSELLRTENLSVYFRVKNTNLKEMLSGKKQYVKAVDGVSFTVNRGDVVALVGESGCGKTTVGKALVSLVKPTGGQVFYSGEDMSSEGRMEKLRSKMQYIFQDPYSSLNPRMVAGTIITRPIKIHRRYGDKAEIKEKLYRLLEQVGLTREHALRFPHEFSGGQKQRISIARALAVEPELIIADEPTAALDVSIQAQILELLLKLKENLGLTMIFISHDLGVVEYIADRILVMYLGTIVESGPVREVIGNPLHPYTKALISAVPKNPLETKSGKLVLQGSIPSPINVPGGCRLHPRCPFAFAECAYENVQLKEVAAGREVACLLVQKETISH
jgi:oligopeptide/dipeptide ABC transporter ATP-binding protein